MPLPGCDAQHNLTMTNNDLEQDLLILWYFSANSTATKSCFFSQILLLSDLHSSPPALQCAHGLGLGAGTHFTWAQSWNTCENQIHSACRPNNGVYSGNNLPLCCFCTLLHKFAHFAFFYYRIAHFCTQCKYSSIACMAEHWALSTLLL